MLGLVGFEPSTIGLKVRNNLNKRLIIHLLTGASVATYAQPCTTDSRKNHARSQICKMSCNQGIGSIPNRRLSHFLSSIYDLRHFQVRVFDFRYFQIVLRL